MRLVRSGTALVWAIASAFVPFGGEAAPLTRVDQPLTAVRLCTSIPIGSPGFRRVATGISHAVTLASERWKARFHQARLALLPPLLMDDSGPAGTPDVKRERHNAQECISHSRRDIPTASSIVVACRTSVARR
jgi:hypothetical protein